LIEALKFTTIIIEDVRETLACQCWKHVSVIPTDIVTPNSSIFSIITSDNVHSTNVSMLFDRLS
jgi:hypothetical protein